MRIVRSERQGVRVSLLKANTSIAQLMYDPMKQVCMKYPEWLAEAKSQLTEEEYNRYGHQYQYFQRIVGENWAKE